MGAQPTKHNSQIVDTVGFCLLVFVVTVVVTAVIIAGVILL